MWIKKRCSSCYCTKDHVSTGYFQGRDYYQCLTCGKVSYVDHDCKWLTEIFTKMDGSLAYHHGNKVYYLELIYIDSDGVISFNVSNGVDLLLDCCIKDKYFIGYDLLNECEFSCTDINSLLDFKWRER